MRKLIIKIGGNDYKIEINRNSIKYMELKGFNMEKLDLYPASYSELLFTASFFKNYPEMPYAKCVELMDTYENEKGDVGQVVKFVMDEYISFINALTDTKNKKQGKIEE